MFGLVNLVVSAEREQRLNPAARKDDRDGAEAQVWLWRHKAFLLIAGMLGLLVIGARGF